MTENVFTSFDPLAYKVNNVSALNREIVKAFKANNVEKIEEILSAGLPITVDVFITIDKHLHACILVVPAGNDSTFAHIQPTSENPMDVPDLVLCWRIDLRYEEVQLKTYQISIKHDLFKEFKKTVKKAFFIGRYKNVRHILCFHLAILRASPNHYNAVLADCVEFAKEFCICLLSYCSNARKLEINVKENIRKATATGLSVEYLSRNFGLSGYLGNLFAGGTDISSFLAGNPLIAVVAIIFILIYPIIVSLFVLYIYNKCILK